jgi:hypothetical protein
MRFEGVILLWLLLPVIATAQQLTGRWEGTLNDAGRITGFQVTFGTPGTIEILGRALPLEGVRVEGDRVVFSTGKTRFEGTVARDRITGVVHEGNAKLAFEMEREPDLPRPANREQAWQQDLDVAERKLLKLDRSFDPAATRRFREAIARLRKAISRKDDAHVIVELGRAVALSGNAHTRLYLLRNRTELRRYPIRVWWFSDGLYVVRTMAEQSRLLSCRVTAIGRFEPRAARARVASLFAGNAAWTDYMSVYSLTSPEVLYGFDIIGDMEKARWSFDCDGKKVTTTLAPLPLVKSTSAVEAWRDLSGPGNDRPLYLRHPDRYYLTEYLQESQLLYFRFNRAANMPEGETLKQFGTRLVAMLRENPVRKLVVDLRFNTGGDLGIGRPLMEELIQAASGRCLYVLTGRATFSAGLFHAAHLKEAGRALVAGEPAGDDLDFWAEGGNIRLPNSGLTVHYANGFHSYSSREYHDRKPYIADLSLASINPDITVSTSFDDYRRGNDPVIEAIVKRHCTEAGRQNHVPATLARRPPL